jgi:sulfur carrier protein ThiS
MITITFNAFSFLQKKLKEKNIEFSNVKLKIPEGITARDLIKILTLDMSDVEAVFVNGKVVLFDTVIQDNDRLAFIPYGMPGPYRVFLGFLKNKNR